MTDNNKKQFAYNYSADEQEELRSIKERYMPKSADSKAEKMAQLRRLDEGVTRKATVVSLILGIIGSLVLGLGMSLFMSELGGALGNAAIPVGIVIGVVGLVLVSLAYPIYNLVVEKERERVAPMILKLADELIEK